MIANGYKHIGGYDAETGKELWKLVGGGDIPTPTPIVANDLVFITSAHGRLAPIYAVYVDAEGAVSAEPGAEGFEHMAWSNPRRGNYMPTPLVYGDELYLCNDAGILSCFASLSGEEHYRERLSSGNTGYTASPVAADGKLYCTSEDGEVQVVKLGPEFEVLADQRPRRGLPGDPGDLRGRALLAHARARDRDRGEDSLEVQA